MRFPAFLLPCVLPQSVTEVMFQTSCLQVSGDTVLQGLWGVTAEANIWDHSGIRGKGLTHFYALSFCSPLLWRHKCFRHSVGLTVIDHSCCHCTGSLWSEAFLLKCFGRWLVWHSWGSSPWCGGWMLQGARPTRAATVKWKKPIPGSRLS